METASSRASFEMCNELYRYKRRDAVLLTEFKLDDAPIANWHGEAHIARVEVLFVDKRRRAVDFGVRAEEAYLLAVFAASPLPLVFAADADIHVAHRHIPAIIASLPFLHELGLGVRIPHQFLRGALNVRVTRERRDQSALQLLRA